MSQLAKRCWWSTAVGGRWESSWKCGRLGPDRATKPVLARVRSDGPLLPPLQVALAQHICRALPRAAGTRDPPNARTRCPGARRARCRARATTGRVAEWSVVPARTRDKVERRVALTEAGRQAVDTPGLGPRQRALLAELRGGDGPVSAARLAERHGTSAVPGLLKRGLVELETARVERLPLAHRAVGERGTLPGEAAADSTPARGGRHRARPHRCGPSRHPAARGPTASGKTRGLRRGHRGGARGRAGARSCWCRRSRWRCPCGSAAP